MMSEAEFAEHPAASEPAGRAPPGRGKRLIVGLRCGRLGNRLFLFANLIALAEEHGYRLINVTFHSYAHLFETTRRDIYCRYPIPNRRSLLDAVPGVAGAIRKTRIFYHFVRTASRLNERFPIFGPRVVTMRERAGQGVIRLDGSEFQDQIRHANIIFLYGWIFRAPSYVRRHAEKIRFYFRPIVEYEQASRQAVDRLRQNSDVVVGVHIRLGDNWKWKGGKYYFPASRYVPWMRQLVAQLPGRKVSFLICSDEPRNEREFPGLAVALGPGSAVGDLYALAKCDYIFGPLSTYTPWASFYGNKPLYLLDSDDDQLELERFRVSYLAEIP